MLRELNQKTLFIKRRTIIEENKVSSYTSIFGKEMGANLAFEDLSTDKTPHTLLFNNIGLIILGFAFGTLITFFWRNDKEFSPYVWIYFAVSFIGSCIFHFLYKENVWKLRLQNYTYIFINSKHPSTAKVDSFIEELYTQRKKYLRETYLHINKNLSYETQFKNLNFLKKSEAITVNEYQNFLNELDALFEYGKKQIGFLRE
ncbi:MAG: hypothetical protein ACLGH8_04775 [Bacteroidia bacterium]